MSKKIVTLLLILGALVVGFITGKYVLPDTQESPKKERKIKYWVAPMDANYRRDKPGKSPMGMDLVPVYEDEPDEKTTERKIKYWVAPMDPNYRRDKPGKSPMGMDLVPVYEEDEVDDGATVKISAQVENNLGVKIESVKKENLSRIINTVGYATVNENRIEHITTYVDGWIRNLAVKTTGEMVEHEQLLLELYSPTLVQAQEEYLLAANSNSSELMKASEQKLVTLGVSRDQINTLKKTKKVMNEIKIHSDQNGIVSNLNVREGMFIKPETRIMTIEDLSNIWVIAEVFERQSSLVKVGQHAIATFPYLPSKKWIGTVEYVYPELDQKTHTLRVRLSFPNIDLLIKPNMYANIKIHSNPLNNVLTIPSTALIRSGDGERVIISLGDGKYRPQRITIGDQSNGKYVVLSGLKEGDNVVTSAQFLIDSESSLKASFSRMESPGTNMKDMDMKEYMAMGIVKRIYLDKQSVLLDHQDIPEISMPAMEMEMSVDEKVDLNKLNEGDHIHFIFIQKGVNDLHITKIEIMPKN